MSPKLKIYFGEIPYECSLETFFDLSLPMKEGDDNPNCYFAESPRFETIRFGDSFVGSVEEGGSCNYCKLTLTPHGNGTHTESYAHISSGNSHVGQAFDKFLFSAVLITVTPEKFGEDDMVISVEQLREIENFPPSEALIVRTLPNGSEKKTRQYSQTNPPYFLPDTGIYLRERGILHLLCDLPSVDRESDGGRLSMHKNFWHYPENIRTTASITELIYVPETVKDGMYCLNLQIPHICTDAVPSRPIIFPVSL